jgi:hypothetical protein
MDSTEHNRAKIRPGTSNPENPLRQKVADAFKDLLDLPGLDAGLPRRGRKRTTGGKVTAPRSRTNRAVE